MSLKFPFVDLKMSNCAFSVCPNREELLQNCPHVEERWEEFGMKYQLNAITSKQLKTLNPIAENEEDAYKMMNFINCVAGDYNLDARDKWKILGWLFSLILLDCPD